MFYVVKKPLGMGSNLVAKILKRVLHVDKMGFAGTLDPLATGLMIIGTNGSPRLFPMIEHFPKTYTATIRLDGTTDSYDLEQPVMPVIVDKEIISTLSKEKIEKIIEENFTGTISQFPPKYSAVWINGQRAYDLARKGHEIEMKAKERVIEKFEILSYTWPTLEVEITVSHGTYIRSLARDLGIKLGTGGYLEKLERVSLGHIILADITDWTQHNDILYAPLAHEALFPAIPVLGLSEAEKKHLRLGSTPIPTAQKNGHYFVAYGNSYGLMEAKEELLFPIKNAV
jgi:tRNA pseudouridine55 synthase